MNAEMPAEKKEASLFDYYSPNILSIRHAFRITTPKITN